MPIKYWPLALHTVAYVLNRTLHTALQGLSPIQLATGREADLSRVRVFGYRAYVQIPKLQRRGKLGDTAWHGVIVGYSTSSPEWIILDPRTLTWRKTYSVKFNETKSGFKHKAHTHGSALRLWDPLVTHQNVDNTNSNEDIHQRYNENIQQGKEPQSSDSADKDDITEEPGQSLEEYSINESMNSQCVSESGHSHYSAPDKEEWVPSSDE